MAESFFANLECELIERTVFKTKAQARTAQFTYIEGWYNPRRRHSGLGYLAPNAFEQRHASVDTDGAALRLAADHRAEDHIIDRERN